ncbi:hypothetical protein E2C01_004302 [Portunus trituberculatus]|uniref:Uncharacterized protein n=1 Tax=Portunus trituberculatus TaxID=210409 RepID=A0A5B7CS20_PORTR|nr:hypothetical protein [Portunus trituberculatus]
MRGVLVRVMADSYAGRFERRFAAWPTEANVGACGTEQDCRSRAVIGEGEGASAGAGARRKGSGYPKYLSVVFCGTLWCGSRWRECVGN